MFWTYELRKSIGHNIENNKGEKATRWILEALEVRNFSIPQR